MSTTTTRRRRIATAITGISAIAVLAAHTGGPVPAAEAEVSAAAHGLPRTTMFTRGEAGYHTFRIPAMVEAPDGSLLAFSEGKVNGPGDWGDMDVVMKRSTDGGATWGPARVLVDDGPNKWSNTVPVVDQRTGRIIVNTHRFDGDAVGEDIECGRAIAGSYTMYSDDNGLTWSEPVDITAQVNPGNWRMISAGPGHGIQISQGEHAGRLIIPGRHSYVEPGQECTELTGAGGHVMYSDDGGTTWQVGATDEQGNEEVRPNEVAVVELDDGRLYFNARDQGNSHGLRLDTTSSDGGETFDEPYSAANDIVTSKVEGALVRLPATRPHKRDRLVLSVPGHPTSREKLTLWSSFDGGEHWERSYEVYDGPSAYSEMLVFTDRHGNREIGVAFEGGERFYPGDQELTYHHDVYFVRVPERLLDAPTPPPEVTPDAAGGHDALISGTPDIVTGKFGKALELAGDFAELPLTDALSFGAEPFTAAAWFRTDYLGNNQALLYAHNRFGPRWTIQVEPNNGNRINAQISTDKGATRTLTAPGDFVDGQWHHVALVRDVDSVALYVDGELAATGTSIGTGSVSAGVRTGIRVGSRVDGINAQFIGAVDEVWLFETALTAAQIAELATDNTVQGATPVTHLPMKQIVRR